jgi:hypothetical protein
MSTQTDINRRLIALFTQQPCWTIDPLAKRLNYSIPSTRRFLAQTGYYSSFTHNGRWYTLASIPRFGRWGLWFHQEIGFSRAGSLTHTLITLVSTSSAGMSAEQLGELLRCRCHSVLVKLVRQNRLQRQRFGRAYVYLAPDDVTSKAQSRMVQKAAAAALPAEIAVLILAEFIRNPTAGFGQLSKTIARRTGILIETGQIQALFDRYGLKKTA